MNDEYYVEWRGKKEMYDKLKNHSNLKDFHTCLSKFVNSLPCAVFYHEGPHKDCSENNHFHIACILPAGVKKFGNLQTYRDMQEAGRLCEYKTKLKKHDKLTVLLQYLFQPPRQYLGCNNADLKVFCVVAKGLNEISTQIIKDAESNAYETDEIDDTDYSSNRKRGAIVLDDEDQGPSNKQQRNKISDNVAAILKKMGMDMKILGPVVAVDGKCSREPSQITLADLCDTNVNRSTGVIDKKRSKSRNNVEFLLSMFKMYACTDAGEILRKLPKNSKQWEDFNELFSSPMYSKISQVAHTRYLVECQSYYDQFMEMTQDTTEGGLLSVAETGQLFLDWCDEFNINPIVYLTQLYLVLTKKGGKLNSFVMIGEPGAGKSYWIECILYLREFVGQCSPDSPGFIFQPLINKLVGYLNEVQLVQGDIEIWKTIMEGLPTSISGKYKNQVMVKGMPIFYTGNNEIWEAAPSSQAAIKDRMFYFKLGKKSNVLEKLVKTYVSKPNPNPYFFKMCFQGIDDWFCTFQILPRDFMEIDEFQDQLEEWMQSNILDKIQVDTPVASPEPEMEMDVPAIEESSDSDMEPSQNQC